MSLNNKKLYISRYYVQKTKLFQLHYVIYHSKSPDHIQSYKAQTVSLALLKTDYFIYVTLHKVSWQIVKYKLQKENKISVNLNEMRNNTTNK